MRELDKILGEIEKQEKRCLNGEYEPAYGAGALDMANAIKDIIRSLSRENKSEITRCPRDNDGWIPVEERLPENAKHKGVFFPKYQVDTKYGVTEGWYNPDVESWYCLFWFITKRYLEHEIDFVKGDVLKVVRVSLESNIVIAWRPLPESYRPERSTK